MKRALTFFCGLLVLAALSETAPAFPPAPYHTVHGLVRDEQGRPLASQEGTVHLLGASNQQIVYAPVGAAVGPGENYILRVPIDSATDARLYQVNATRPALPFTIRVVIKGVVHVPIEMTGATWTMGKAAQNTRLDLTLGVDSDGDGLPDAWEQRLIDSDESGRLKSLADVRPEDDADSDGFTNLQEYLIGTYALDLLDALKLEVVATTEEATQLEFTAITGRSYRLRSSTDAVTWTHESFAIEPGGELSGRWQADDIRLLNVFVPRDATTPTKLFRLYVD